MALPLSNTFEGGSAGTTLTTANTGGASGDAFQSIVLTPTFSASPARGTLSMQIAQVVYSESFVRWDGAGSLTTNVYARAYLWIPANPTVNQRVIHFITSGAAISAAIRISTTGVVIGLNAVGGAITGLTGSTVVAKNQWIRLEARCKSSTTVGELEWRLFNTDPDATSPTETLTSGSTEVLGADTDRLYVGTIGSSGTANQTWNFDDLAFASAGWIGPSGASLSDNAYPRDFTEHTFGPF